MTVGLGCVPAIELRGGLVDDDAFVKRRRRDNDVGTPDGQAGGIVYDAVVRLLNSGPLDELAVPDAVGESVRNLSAEHPPAPTVEGRIFVPVVSGKLLVPAPLMSVSACLDYWTDRDLRILS